MPKNNSKNKHYTKEFKESILKRIESSNESVPKVSEEIGIPKSTIYTWMHSKAKKDNQHSTRSSNNHSSKWGSEDKFHVVLETCTLTEEELAAYCRKKGIYIDDVKTWRKQCLKANTTISKDPQQINEEIKEEKLKNKKLEKELRFKEKALAETAALLVLRKKANTIWGDPEED
ncbi:MAG: transposase [Clostridiaceae bacterium]|nr:transposase [Clostridiaceae bacterium]